MKLYFVHGAQIRSLEVQEPWDSNPHWRWPKLVQPSVGLEDFCVLVRLTMRTDVIDLPSPQDLREDFKAAQAFVERCDGQLLYVQGSVTDKAGLDKICADISEKEGRFE
jgi:hypothetical protein